MDDRIAPIVFAMRHFNPLLTEEEVKMVTDQLVLKSYKKNDYFIREGQIPKEIGFCVKGAFRQFYRKQDKEVNCNFMLEYDFLVAYASMLRHEPSRYYIQALEDCEILSYSTTNSEELYCSTRNWERYGRHVAQWVVLQLNDQLEALQFSNAKERYNDLLAKHSNWLGRIPLKYIATYLGIEQETLSRLRAKSTARQEVLR